jgi:hypothetical protein
MNWAPKIDKKPLFYGPPCIMANFANLKKFLTSFNFSYGDIFCSPAPEKGIANFATKLFATKAHNFLW